MKTVVLINKGAAKGRSGKRWARIASTVRSLLPEETVEVGFVPPFDLEQPLYRWVNEENVRCFISAGGDGSLSLLLNALFRMKGIDPASFFLGAVGLGSSNDFHKPVRQHLEGIPIRLDHSRARLADVVKVEYLTPEGFRQSRYFLINASLGVTAEANYLFNRENTLLRFLKRYFTGAAIFYAAVKTILSFRNFSVRLREGEGRSRPVQLSNLAVLKNRHVSGSLLYDQEVKADDGRLGVNYVENQNRRQLLRTLYDLSQGRFSGRPGRVSFFAERLEVLTGHSVALEADGEVWPAADLVFTVLPRYVNLLG